MQSEQVKIDAALINLALQEVLQSSHFRSSKQCKLLLRYVVKHTLAGEDELLRERVIGAEVFGRAPDYDSGNDPIVRARVAEVRKRLAQFYLEHREGNGVTISIPSGSYKAAFAQEPDQPTQAPYAVNDLVPRLEVEPASLLLSPKISLDGEKNTSHRALHKNKWPLWLVLATSLLVLRGAAVWLQHRTTQEKSQRAYEKFWEPLSSATTPPVLYIGANYTYRLSPQYLESYQAQHHLPYTGPEFFVDLKPNESIPEKELLPTRNFIGFGDVAATSRIVATLTALGKKYDLRYGDDIAVTDLHASPVIFVGGFSNSWAMQLTHDLRYTLEQGDRIVDHIDSSKSWQRKADNSNGSSYDYVIISRLLKSRTGGVALVIAGVGSCGNQAAADFISDPAQIAKLLHTAPPGWEHKNMQVVLRTSTINEIPVSTDIEAVYFW